MQIRALVVDDEKSGRENLSGLLSSYCPQIQVAGHAASVKEALELIRQAQPQLVFLDIEMPGGNGFGLLEAFDDYPFEVIFVTAYDNYAIRAIRFSAADYILKPINRNELITAVEKVSQRIRQQMENERVKQLFYNIRHPQDQKIGLPANNRIKFVEIKNIIRCQGESNYTHLFFEDKKSMLVAKTLVEFEELLQEHHFIRVHKTHLINLNHVTAFLRDDGGRLLLSNGESIPVSRRRKDFVREKLKLKR